MTKEQNEFLRMTKPLPFRRIRLVAKTFVLRVQGICLGIQLKIAKMIVNVEEAFGIVKHICYNEERKDAVKDLGVVGTIEIQNLMFDVRVSREYCIETFYDYFKKKNGDICRDDTKVFGSYVYTAVPVNANLRIGDSVYNIINYENHASYAKFVMVDSITHKRYTFDADKFSRIHWKRTIPKELYDAIREKDLYDKQICSDFIEVVNKDMEKFKLLDYLKEA